MTKKYQYYEEIPVLMRDYVTFVAGKKTVEDIPLEDINEYLRGLDTFEVTNKDGRYEEYEDGWVI